MAPSDVAFTAQFLACDACDACDRLYFAESLKSKFEKLIGELAA
jgi:hypothetical protein